MEEGGLSNVTERAANRGHFILLWKADNRLLSELTLAKSRCGRLCSALRQPLELLPPTTPALTVIGSLENSIRCTTGYFSNVRALESLPCWRSVFLPSGSLIFLALALGSHVRDFMAPYLFVGGGRRNDGADIARNGVWNFVGFFSSGDLEITLELPWSDLEVILKLP